MKDELEDNTKELESADPAAEQVDDESTDEVKESSILNPDVDAFLKESKYPRAKYITRVREIILESDARIEECIKWSSPTFLYKGNMASFFMNASKTLTLMFHKGGYLPNEMELLTGDSKEGRVVRFEDMEDIESKREALVAIVQEWIVYKNQNEAA